MKIKIIVPSALLLILAAGQVNAQETEVSTMPGPTNGRPTESSGPMAPGNPNTSTTVVTPVIPNDNTGAMAYPNMNTGTSARTLNSITPSSGNKPSFSSLNADHDGTLDKKDLQPVYTGLYQQYITQKNGATSTPAAPPQQ
jgi:hypothetical protein